MSQEKAKVRRPLAVIAMKMPGPIWRKIISGFSRRELAPHVVKQWEEGKLARIVENKGGE